MKKITITIDEDTVFDAIKGAFRVFAKKPDPTESEINNWLSENIEMVKEHLVYYAIDGAVRSVFNPLDAREVKEPVLSFDDGRIKLFAYDAEEHIQMRVLKMVGNEWNAGLVYVQQGGAYSEREVNLRDKNTWEWIQKYMELGMRAEKELQKAAQV